MVKSMTGFASFTHEEASATVTVTVRAVNHRFLDVQVRLPQALGAFEPMVRGSAGRHVARGRLEITLSVHQRAVSSLDVQMNEAFVEALSSVVGRARDRGLVAGALTPGDLVRMPQALTIRERGEVIDPASDVALSAAVDACVTRTLADLDVMRVREGELLRVDMAQRVAWLAETIATVARAADEGTAQLKSRLAERVGTLSADLPVDPTLVAQEVVKFAARSDISEEVTRFRAHLTHWDALTAGQEPCGRKLDFLLQEMNREVNTIGSKADGLGVAELVIATKAELEKLREQVQNVE